MNPVTLAPFAPDHAAGAVEVIRAVFEEYGMTFDLEDFDRDLQDIPEHYAGCGGAFWVLLDGDRVVGTVAVVPKDAATAELKRLYLLSVYRRIGFRQIGERAVEDLDRSREYGFVLPLDD
ncbi:MAG: hypothetical protein HYU51_17110 [Candidatus Rokubacteria bacterium]|nr:hypothetical protein [Candidatus Rokubacteria bacterium]